MLDVPQSLLSPSIRQLLVDTPLQSSVEGFVQYLAVHGYASPTMRFYVGAFAHFSRWLRIVKCDVRAVEDRVIHRFLRHLPHCHCAKDCRRRGSSIRAALEHLLKYLRASGQVATPCKVSGPLHRELEDFEHYLLQVRGVGLTTRDIRLNHIRAFLREQFGSRPIVLRSLDGGSIERFLTRYTQGWTAESRNTVCVSVRSFLRFKAIHGEAVERLVTAVPQIPTRRLARLPQTVSEPQIKRLLAAFDRGSAVGRRDLAIAHCLVDLGLRAGEVPRLTLEDIDWRAGTICVHGKGRRADWLPLPKALGQAIAQYLRGGRPSTASRSLFVRHHAPLDVPISAYIVRRIIRSAARRCGVSALAQGPHLLRHSAAQRLVEGGATLKTVADFLRHKSLDTTTIYTKVDLHSLSEVALPWPGSMP